jgi:hypothetical protein
VINPDENYLEVGAGDILPAVDETVHGRTKESAILKKSKFSSSFVLLGNVNVFGLVDAARKKHYPEYDH